MIEFKHSLTHILVILYTAVVSAVVNERIQLFVHFTQTHLFIAGCGGSSFTSDFDSLRRSIGQNASVLQENMFII